MDIICFGKKKEISIRLFTCKNIISDTCLVPEKIETSIHESEILANSMYWNKTLHIIQ